MIGKYPAKLDDKNRLFVPAKLRSELGEDFYVTLGVNCGHRCLTVYTAEEWQKLSDNYNALSLAQRSGATQGAVHISAIRLNIESFQTFVQKDGNMMKFRHNPMASKDASNFSGVRFSSSNAANSSASQISA